MKKILLVLSVLAMLGLGGCQSYQMGGASQKFSVISKQDFEKSLVVGKTTKQDVFAEYGRADKASVMDGFTSWTYYLSKGVTTYLYVPGHFESESRSATLAFDKQGVLVKYDTYGF